jgi:hypothetical protein
LSEYKALRFLIENVKLPPDVAHALSQCSTAEAMFEKAAGQEDTQEVQRLIGILAGIKEKGFLRHIFETYVWPNVPKFLYFDEYYQMQGCDNVETLLQRESSEKLKPSDYPLLGLVGLARLKLNELLNTTRTQELKNRLEGAGNLLTRRVIKYWSQNKHLQMRFDIRPARPQDPEGMRGDEYLA